MHYLLSGIVLISSVLLIPDAHAQSASPAPAQQAAPAQPQDEATPSPAAAEPSTSASPTQAPRAGEQQFDAEPLLNAMIELRSVALTCEEFVNNSPVERTNGIVAYFERLGQELPDLSDTTTQSSLNRFVGSQAALLCTDMLDDAFDAYFAQAQVYEDNRPEQWPGAPAAPKAPWCSAPYCLDR